MGRQTKHYYVDPQSGQTRKAFEWVVAASAFMIGYRAVRCRRFVRLFDLDTGRQVKRYAIVGGKVLV